MRIVKVPADFETLTYSEVGIISPPYGYKEPLRSRLRKGIVLVMFGLFVVLLVIAAAETVLSMILHLPFVLLAMAWGYWRGSRRKAVTTEGAGQQSLQWDASSKSDQSGFRQADLTPVTPTVRRPVKRRCAIFLVQDNPSVREIVEDQSNRDAPRGQTTWDCAPVLPTV